MWLQQSQQTLTLVQKKKSRNKQIVSNVSVTVEVNCKNEVTNQEKGKLVRMDGFSIQQQWVFFSCLSSATTQKPWIFPPPLSSQDNSAFEEGCNSSPTGLKTPLSSGLLLLLRTNHIPWPTIPGWGGGTLDPMSGCTAPVNSLQVGLVSLETLNCQLLIHPHCNYISHFVLINHNSACFVLLVRP